MRKKRGWEGTDAGVEVVVRGEVDAVAEGAAAAAAGDELGGGEGEGWGFGGSGHVCGSNLEVSLFESGV